MSIDTIKAAARGRWASILMGHGIDERAFNGKHQPCPRGEGTDRFRWDAKTERFYCACAKGGDGFDLLRCVRGLSSEEAMKQVGNEVGARETEEDRKRREKALEVVETNRDRIKRLMLRCSSAHPQVTQYLIARGLPKETHPDTLFGSSDIKYYQDNKPLGSYPAMVAVVRDTDSMPKTLHVTYLDGRGGKANVEQVRKIMTPTGRWNGCAVRLWPLNGESLIVAEGIETAIAARALLGMMLSETVPAWACLNADNLRNFEVPLGVNRVIIAADNDKSYTGQAAGYELARRITAGGKIASVHLPARLGTDMLDLFVAVNRCYPRPLRGRARGVDDQ
jgi:putative DNA primase/helicase